MHLLAFLIGVVVGAGGVYLYLHKAYLNALAAHLKADLQKAKDLL